MFRSAVLNSVIVNWGRMESLQKRLSPEKRRKQLMLAAMSCYGTLGVERAGHGDIAKLAGVSTATVFNYFGTRENLTEAVFRIVYENFQDIFPPMTSPMSLSDDPFADLAEKYVSFVENRPDVLKVVLNWSSSFGQSVRPQYLEFQDWLLLGIQRRLNHLGGDQTDARIILAAAYNYARMKLDNTPEDVLERFVERTIKAMS